MSAASRVGNFVYELHGELKQRQEPKPQEKHQKPLTFNPIFTLIKGKEGEVIVSGGLTPGNYMPAPSWASVL